jgi:hypothetical protein
MHLEGSCHCGSVRFSVDADAPVPFMRCYCSICRKTAGGGGYAINLGAQTHTMKVKGQRHLGIYRAKLPDKSGKGMHEQRPALFLPALRQRALAVGPDLARAGAPARQRHRHAAAGTAVAGPLSRRLQGAVGERGGLAR